MDTKKARALATELNKEIDGIIDAAVKARKINLLRPLTLIQNNVGLIETHLTTVDERLAPKAKKVDEAPAAEAPAKGKK